MRVNAQAELRALVIEFALLRWQQQKIVDQKPDDRVHHPLHKRYEQKKTFKNEQSKMT